MSLLLTVGYNWEMLWFYYTARLVLKMLLMLLTRCRVEGKENVPDKGALLVVANHVNLVDPPILGITLGRKMIFMAKKELFHSRMIGYFIRSLGAFPVHRGQLDRKAMQHAQQVLTDGLALLMFPEGMRSRSGRLRPAFSGSALIALRSGALILPVGIIGTEKIKGIAWLLRRPQITVNIGHPFYLPPVSSELTKGKLAELTSSIMRHIAELLPKEYRGIYAV